ncbi:MAG: Spy/CpxP family protein refolding chaperone [Cyanobacteria bacterium P01_H01_bin.15]
MSRSVPNRLALAGAITLLLATTAQAKGQFGHNNQLSIASPITALAEDLPSVRQRYSTLQVLAQAPGEILETLDLNSQQRQQIEAIHGKYRNQFRSNRDALRRAQEDLNRLSASDASSSEVQAQQEKVKTLRSQLQDLLFESRLEIREILTQEQRMQLNEALQLRRDERGRP